MRPVTTLAAYAGALVVVFGAAFGIGAAVGPVGPAASPAPAHSAEPHTADPRTSDDEQHPHGTSSPGGAP